MCFSRICLQREGKALKEPHLRCISRHPPFLLPNFLTQYLFCLLFAFVLIFKINTWPRAKLYLQKRSNLRKIRNNTFVSGTLGFFSVRYLIGLMSPHSLFSSFLNYGILAWWLTYGSYLEPLFRLQKRVLRCIKFEPFSSPRTPIFQSLRIFKLEDVLHLNILTFVYKTINKLSPSCFHYYFSLKQLFIRLGPVRLPEVIFSNPLKILDYMVFKQLNILVLNFGTLSHFLYALQTLSSYFVQN